jgi:enamine deaminase RidA (YjgF/YER057c/UK114 family)
MKVVQPEHWAKPRGYANGILAEGPVLYVAGQIGWDESGHFASDDLIAQFDQALANVVAVLRAGGAEPTDVVRMTIYVTDLPAYREGASRLGGVWRAHFGRHYPAMALVGVAGLVEPRAKVEIEATAVLANRAAPADR